jgi:hypothetical protein
MSATTGPQSSDEDKNEPERQDVEKSEVQREAVGAEIGIMPEGEGSSFEPEEDPEAQS